MRQLLAACVLSLVLMPVPAHAAADAKGGALIRDFLAAYDAVQTFQGKIRSTTRKGDKVLHAQSMLWLQKPASTALQLLEAPEAPATEGTKLVWFGDPTVDVATRIFGFRLTGKPRIDDPRIAGLRGWTMRDLSIVSFVALAKDPRTQVRYVGPGTHLGRPQSVIEVKGPRLISTVDRQQVWIDDQLKLPMLMEMYDGAETALRLEVETFQFDKKLPANTFSL